MEFLAHQLSLGERHKESLSLLVLDIDRFSRINENFGREDGDAILKEFSSFLASLVRNSDVLARSSCEQFMLILMMAGLESGTAVAERLRSDIQAGTFHGLPNLLTVSIGVAEQRTGEDFETLVARAETALRQAKVGGRNRVEQSI